jgi:hypothetical protein
MVMLGQDLRIPLVTDLEQQLGRILHVSEQNVTIPRRHIMSVRFPRCRALAVVEAS